MINKIFDGESVEYSNASGSTISSGACVSYLGKVWVALADIADGSSGTIIGEGVFNLAKTTSQTWVVGDKLFMNTSTRALTNVGGSGYPYAGRCFTAAGSSDTTGDCFLSDSVPTQAGIVAFSAGANITSVPGSFADVAAVRTYLLTLVSELETRLDASDTFNAALLVALKASGQMSNS